MSYQNLLEENCMSLARAAKRLPRVRGERPPHPSTLFRWATQGRRARSGKTVRLEVCKVGGTNCTSLEALERFVDRLNDVEPVDLPKRRSQPALEEQAEKAKRILRRRGLVK